MEVGAIGEFGLIGRLAALVGRPAPGLVVGIGDDAAVWRAGDTYVVATTDTLVAGVHFLPGLHPWPDLGWKALAVNVSDVAAMGGVPEFALVTLALPPETSLEAVEALYRGLDDCARAYGVTVAGGDVVRAGELAITVALLGHAQTGADGHPLLLRRDGARPGHALAVSGTLGDAAAGLELLQAGAREGPLVSAHLRPRPPLALGQRAARLGIPCGIDVSDGLLQDLGHVCRLSGVGAVVRAADLPIGDELRRAFPDRALALACSGGEDYQLLLAGPREALEGLAGNADVPLSVVGEIVAGEGVQLVDETGRPLEVPMAGWDHLRRL
ncbi:MAG TPA: thiamine-phosphate kinase [Dehalococcoidia bacterium]|nr:thiamine-phosphate kinase [Dehalococcoidia bacterium]